MEGLDMDMACPRKVRAAAPLCASALSQPCTSALADRLLSLGAAGAMRAPGRLDTVGFSL